MKRRPVRRGEPLALDPRSIRSDRKAIWWDFFSQIPENEQCELEDGSKVCVVSIRGSLEHHAGIFGDSYDAIRQRVTEACECDDNAAVILRLDSPGGVVSGLNETVRWLRTLPQKYGKPVLGYVDELAASAAFALSCGCQQVFAPRDAIVGSIGVIATMYDQVKFDQKLGFNFVTLTSGDRKSDGHPHVPISDEALAAEQGRIDRLALGFYKLVADARPVSLVDLKSSRGFQAGIFLAPKAAKMGLIDGVQSWDSFLGVLPEHLASMGLDKASSSAPTSKSTADLKGNETDRRAAPQEAKMTINLLASLKQLKSQLAEASDPEKKAALTAQISHLEAAIEAGKKIQHEKHEKKTVTQDDDDDDGDDGDDDGDSDDGDGDDESADHDEPDGDEGDDMGDDEEDEEEEDEEEAAHDEEDEEAASKSDEDEARKSASLAANSVADPSTRKKVRRAVHAAVVDARSKVRASLAPVLKAARRATGQRSLKAIVGGLQAMPARLKTADKVLHKVEKLESDNRKARVNSMLKEAKRAGKVTPAQMSSLREQGLKDPAWLKGHLAVLPRIVRSKEAGGFVPREGADGAGAPSSEEQRKMRAAAMANLTPDERAKWDAREQEMSAKRSNGVPRI